MAEHQQICETDQADADHKAMLNEFRETQTMILIDEMQSTRSIGRTRGGPQGSPALPLLAHQCVAEQLYDLQDLWQSKSMGCELQPLLPSGKNLWQKIVFADKYLNTKEAFA